MKKIIKKSVLLSVITASSLLIPSYAEVAVPANVDPGAINAQIKIKPNNNYVKPKKELIDLSKVTPQETPAVHYSRKFLLNGINYTGNTVFKTEELKEICSELTGKEVSFEDINNVVKAITNLYKKEGYLTSMAIIPPHTMKDGIVEITVVEGKIGDIEINGGKWVKAKYLKNNIFKSNNVEENEIFNVNYLSQSMSQINSPKYLKGKVK